MPEVGGELGHLPPNVEAGPVPFEEPAGRERVAHVQEPRPVALAPARCRRAQADHLGDPGEGISGDLLIETRAALGDEECLALASRTEAVAMLRVVSESLTGRFVNRDERCLG